MFEFLFATPKRVGVTLVVLALLLVASRLAASDTGTNYAELVHTTFSKGETGYNYTELVHTTFSKGETGTWSTGSGDGHTITIRNGALTLGISRENLAVSSLSDEVTNLADGSITAVVQATGSGGAGLVGRKTGGTQGYYCYIWVDGTYSCYKRTNATWITLVERQASQAIKLYEPNVIGLQIVGNEISFVVNHKRVAKVNDSDLASGTWGVSAQTGMAPASFQAAYTEILIAQIK